MKMAAKILAKASGVRTDAPENPVQLLQISEISDPRERAAALLRKAAERTHSHALARLAQEVSIRPDGRTDSPLEMGARDKTYSLDKVSDMIQRMIWHLQKEQKEEDDHKNWCDLELSNTGIS